jgi:hypothetical protein
VAAFVKGDSELEEPGRAESAEIHV